MRNRFNMTCTWLGLIGFGCAALVAVSVDRLAAAPRGSDIKIAAVVEVPDIIAVRIRHDMCPFCKKFDPQFPNLVRQATEDSVLFVTLDLSSEETQRQAALLVGALGLEKVWTGDMSKMGTIVFVDGKSKKILASTHQTDAKTVRVAMRKALALSRGDR